MHGTFFVIFQVSMISRACGNPVNCSYYPDQCNRTEYSFKAVERLHKDQWRISSHQVLPSGYLFMDAFLSSVSKKSFMNATRVSNSLDPDQAQHSVGPDLIPNCLQRLSADETSR